MDAEQLKALLEKAVAQVEEQKTLNTKNAEQIKELQTGLDAALASKDDQAIEDLKNEIADLQAKYVAPSAAISEKDQKQAVQTFAVKAFNKFVRSAKKGGAQAGTDLKSFLGGMADEFKTLNITAAESGGAAVAEVLSTDLIEYGREFSPILSLIGMKNGLTRDFRELVLVSYPSVGDGIENVAGVELAETDTQTYAEVKADVIKLYANPRITDEALLGTDYNVYADLVRLIGDEIGVTLAAKILFGDGTAKNGRGILSSGRVDITAGTGQSFKPTMGADARDADYFPVAATGVDGGLGTDSAAIVDFLVDLETKLPTKYLNGARFVMNRKTRAVIKKIKDADGHPIFIDSYRTGGAAELLGYPVTIDDTLPNIASNSFPIIFGDIGRAFAMANGDIDYMQSNPYKIQGVTVLEYNKEVFSIMQASDAILVVSCTTNAAA